VANSDSRATTIPEEAAAEAERRLAELGIEPEPNEEEAGNVEVTMVGRGGVLGRGGRRVT
jgi:hypothetical protein